MLNTSVIFHLLMNLPAPATNTAEGRPDPISSSLTKESYFENEYGDCRGIFGCFPTGPPWLGRDRPIILAPFTIDRINPSFCLYTPSSPSCYPLDVFNSTSIDRAKINHKTQLILVTHGFLHSGTMPWLLKLVFSLIDEHAGDPTFAAIAVDWRRGAHPPYAQAVANIRIVGAVAGRLLHLLMDRKGLKASKIHLVGHSLGSHLFGYAGAYVKKYTRGTLVGRITGLDPAGPYFKAGPPEVKLDQTDAEVVVGIHTDSTNLIPTLPESLGIGEAVGHIDFFPDGGGQQARCKDLSQNDLLKLKDVSSTLVSMMTCSHMKSYQYFTASASKKCSFIGVECPSWSDFRKGLCWDCGQRVCYKMGFHLERFYPPGHPGLATSSAAPVNQLTNRTTLYLATADSEQFCGSQVRLSIVSSTSKNTSFESQFVRVFLTLRGNLGSALTSPPDRVIELGPESPVTWVDSIEDIGAINSIVFSYVIEEGLLQSMFWSQASEPLQLSQTIFEELHSGKRFTFYFCNGLLAPGEVSILKMRPCNLESSRTI